MIRMSGICRRYETPAGPVEALRSVELWVKQGEFVAITGPSGSGKSTLMQLIGCLDVPTAGSYWFAGEPVPYGDRKALSALRRRQVGFVFQSFHLMPRMTALENVEIPLLFAGVPAAERAKRAKEALLQVGLEDRMTHLPGQLSGGQRQRVAIARAVAQRTGLLLADEPTGNLDPEAASSVMALLQTLWRQGKTVLLITHDRRFAGECPRLLRMAEGRIAEDSARPAQENGDTNAGG